jgi:hypothetical protein
MRSGFLLLAVVALVSCKTDSSLSPRPDPAQRWHSFHIHDYTIEQLRSCFCRNGGQTMRLTVKADTVFSVVRVEDGKALSADEAAPYWSIEEMFDFIKVSKDSLVIRYNAQYGYLEYLDINPQLHPVDGGALYVTSNLKM